MSGRPRAARPRAAPMVLMIRTCLQLGIMAGPSSLSGPIKADSCATVCLNRDSCRKWTSDSRRTDQGVRRFYQLAQRRLKAIVLHGQGHTHMARSRLAETFARHHGNVVILQKAQGKLFARKARGAYVQHD